MLHFPELLLIDHEVIAAYGSAFLNATESSTLEVPNATRCPGLLPLLAHPNETLRCRVRPLLLNCEIDDLTPLFSVLDHWMRLLEFDLFEEPAASLAEGRRPFHQPQTELWMGLHCVLKLMKPRAMEVLVVKYPFLINVVLGAVGRGDPSATWFKHALHVLQLLLQVLGSSLWISSSFPPETVCEFLLGAAFNIRSEPVHTLLLHVFSPFLHSLKRIDPASFRKLRRRLVYFLLQQVRVSCSFLSQVPSAYPHAA